MLNSFIKFTENQYTAEEQTECLDLVDNTYQLPIKAGDVVKFIVDKETITYRGDEVDELKIGLSSCGIIVKEDIGTLIEGEDQVYCTATIPATLDYYENEDDYTVTVISEYSCSLNPVLGDISSSFSGGQKVKVNTILGYVITEIESSIYTDRVILTFTDSVFSSDIISSSDVTLEGVGWSTFQVNVFDFDVSGAGWALDDIFIINGNRYVWIGWGSYDDDGVLAFDQFQSDFVPFEIGVEYTLYHMEFFTITKSMITLTHQTPTLSDCVYEFVIYTDAKDIDCSVFEGMTLGQVIATGVKLKDVLGCTLNDFIL